MNDLGLIAHTDDLQPDDELKLDGRRLRVTRRVEERNQEPVSGLAFPRSPLWVFRCSRVSASALASLVVTRPLRVLEEPASGLAFTYRTYGYTLGEIAEDMGCHYSTESRRLRRSAMRERKT